MKSSRILALPFVLAIALTAAATCAPAPQSEEPAMSESDARIRAGLDKYIEFELASDLSALSDNQRQMVPLLIDAVKVMDEIYWQQAYGDPTQLLADAPDPETRRFIEMNFGPWDRLDGNRSFVNDVGPKPAGANFYPADIGREEVEAEGDPALTSLYTLVRRDQQGGLVAVPYHEEYASQVELVAGKLLQAAELAEDPGLRRYLELRAEALVTDEYQQSDLAWMDMKNNTIELVIGPIETYEDQLLGAKAAYEGYLLIKDRAWSERLARYTSFLPSLQRGLPVEDTYKQEEPGTDAELNAYDLIYVGGDGNTGSKTIAINLPNDEQVQLQKGTRRIQIKNVMQAKFENILAPIADELLDPSQRGNVTFDAFFANTMFHEVAHGLGIKNTLDGSGTVRNAMREQASWLEEGKADILGLYMITALHEQGELGEADLLDYYVTFFTSIFRSIRFGASSAHGRANLVRFNFFRQLGAFQYDEGSGRYTVNFDRMQEAVAALSSRILILQGDGDRDGAAAFHDQMAVTGETLRSSLDQLADKHIPVDLVYRQGLGL